MFAIKVMSKGMSDYTVYQCESYGVVSSDGECRLMLNDGSDVPVQVGVQSIAFVMNEKGATIDRISAPVVAPSAPKAASAWFAPN